MTNIATWWNSLSRKQRAAWLAMHRLRTSVAIFTWHVLNKRDQRRIQQAWEQG